MRLFVHMPKCAGTSVYHVLDAAAHDDVVRDYDSLFKIPLDQRKLKIDLFSCHPEKIDERKIVYGHFFPIKYIGVNKNRKFKLVTILRDPIDRIISHYKFWNSHQFSDHYLWKKMKDQKWTLMEFAMSTEMCNFYKQYFYGISMEDFSFIGIYENLDYSVKMCLQELSVSFEDGVVIPNLNVTESTCEMKLSHDDIVKLKNFHGEDYEIYNFAKKKFHEINDAVLRAHPSARMDLCG